MVSVPYSVTYLRSIIWKAAYLVLLSYRTGLLKLAAVITTFYGTINQTLLAATGKASVMSVGTSFVSEAYTKFLGAAPNLLQGFKSLNSFDFVAAVVSFWEGAAALIMMFWLWDLVRAKGMTSEVEWPEKALLLALWLTLSSLVHGTGLVQALFNQVRLLLDSVQGWLPELGGNSSLNNSADLPLNGSNSS